MSDKRMPSSRKYQLKSLILAAGDRLLEAEAAATEATKKAYLEEKCPELDLSGTVADIQDLCKKLHSSIDKVDEERYDLTVKLAKTEKEIKELKRSVIDLKGKFKKPALKKVRLSADQMLQALLGSTQKATLDLRSNLKQVKKGAKDEETMSDWRKNIDDKTGMGGRKKMFETS